MAYTAKQNLFMRAMLAVVAKTGVWDKTNGPDGAGYTSASLNAGRESGRACHNCAFFRTPNGCAVVKGPVEREGTCRFSIIAVERLVRPQSQSVAGLVRRGRMQGETVE